MASIKKLNSGNYEIRVSNGRKADKSQNIETTTWRPQPGMTERQVAKAVAVFAMQFEEKVKTGQYLSGEKMTLSEYIDIWRTEYAEKQLEKTSIERSEITFRSVLSHIGHIKLAALLPLHLQTMYSKIQKDGYLKNGKHRAYSNNTIKRMHADISGALNVAVMWGLIENNPCSRTKPPKVQRNPTGPKHFTIDEAREFLGFLERDYTATYRGRKKKNGESSAECIKIRRVPTQVKVLINMAVFGGFRRGELVALKWPDIDFGKCSVSVTKATVRVKDEDGVYYQKTGTPKTKSSIRIVSLPPSVMALLKNHRTEQLEQRLMLGSAWQGEDYIFAQLDGKQMDISTPNATFRKLIERYNDGAKAHLLPIISFHGLRHTSATLSIAAGADVRSLSGRLGHADTSTTMDIYAHQLKEMDEKIANALEDILAVKHA